ncbi:MAG: HNH endonuclease, partial [Actinomycetota bacterium]|nr:HNH endonuclease [Actinomycetota bacterium]
PEDGALLLTALQRARDALRERRREEHAEAKGAEAQRKRAPQAAEEADAEAEAEAARREPERFQPTPEQLRVTHLDALVAMDDVALARAPGERSGGERAQVVVHVDAGVLARDEGGRCELEEGPAIAPETARRIACDASLVTLREREGETLSLGRKTRSVSAALRRVLKERDGGCRFPGCQNTRFLDAHHLEHWAKGGETSLDNLILLCRPHHRHLHEDGCRLERLEDGSVRFRNRYGVVIPSVPRPPPSDREALREENRRRGLVIDADTCQPGIADPMDLSMAVDALDEIIGSSRAAARK